MSLAAILILSTVWGGLGFFLGWHSRGNEVSTLRKEVAELEAEKRLGRVLNA
jgi:hypothetical protein